MFIVNKGKLDPKAVKCVFVEYPSTQKGYKCYHLLFKKFYVSVDVIFNENESYFTTPYLHVESSVMEDKEDFILIDLPSSSKQLVSPESQNSKPKTGAMSMSVESWNSESVVLDDRMVGQVYSRTKAAVLEL